MRALVLGLALLLELALQASAADLGPILRGTTVYQPPVQVNWSGYYAGAQVGYSSAGFGFGNATSSLIAFILRGTTLEAEAGVSGLTTLSNRDSNGTTFGGFVGYNAQWDDVVLGLEFNYNASSIKAQSSDTLARSFTTSDGYFHDFTVTSAASAKLTDFGAVRVRAGWATGNFLPYAAVGLAIGRVDIAHTATVSDVATQTGFPTLVLPPTTEGSTRTGVFAYGYMGALGVDMILWSNVFARLEGEYLQFTPVQDVRIHVGTFRTAIGVRF
jgi:outer membrane immunogenic protein